MLNLAIHVQMDTEERPGRSARHTSKGNLPSFAEHSAPVSMMELWDLSLHSSMQLTMAFEFQHFGDFMWRIVETEQPWLRSGLMPHTQQNSTDVDDDAVTACWEIVNWAR